MTGPICPKRLRWLLEHHAAALELYARQFCRCTEDVVQEAVIELAAQRELPQDDVAWLYGVVRHKAISAARSERRRKQREDRVAEGRTESFCALPEQADEARLAAAALESLPQQQRELVVAHIWGGLTFEQIGHLMGISGSTAHRQYHESLAAIRKRLSLPCRKNP
ncbi:MAG: RNA polymerase sigma factor [Thermoguttaceae bacterium]